MGLSSSNPAFAELLFTPDLSSGVVESQDTPLVSGQPVGYTNLYVADTHTGSYEPVTPVTPEAEYEPFQEEQAGEEPQAEGASTDLSHVVFQQGASLCCGAAPGRTQQHIYEWAGGRLALVDVPPHGRETGEPHGKRRQRGIGGQLHPAGGTMGTRGVRFRLMGRG